MSYVAEDLHRDRFDAVGGRILLLVKSNLAG